MTTEPEQYIIALSVGLIDDYPTMNEEGPVIRRYMVEIVHNLLVRAKRDELTEITPEFIRDELLKHSDLEAHLVRNFDDVEREEHLIAYSIEEYLYHVGFDIGGFGALKNVIKLIFTPSMVRNRVSAIVSLEEPKLKKEA